MSIFETIKHIDEYGNEYWLARELQKVLEYFQWRRFDEVINRAKIACLNSGYNIDHHFANVGKMVQIGSKTSRQLLDNMGSVELAANLFRIIQTEEQLRNNSVIGEDNANKTHYKMGKDVRKFIEKHGGTMPERLPKPGKSLKELEKDNKMVL